MVHRRAALHIESYSCKGSEWTSAAPNGLTEIRCDIKRMRHPCRLLQRFPFGAHFTSFQSVRTSSSLRDNLHCVARRARKSCEIHFPAAIPDCALLRGYPGSPIGCTRSYLYSRVRPIVQSNRIGPVAMDGGQNAHKAPLRIACFAWQDRLH
jgi:hypothetical protein